MRGYIRRLQAASGVDVPTIVAIGVVSGLLVFVTHEILGHGLMTVVLGGHLVRVSTIDSSYRGPSSPTVMRVIAAAGIMANLVIGSAVLWIARFVPIGSFNLRYFAWFFGYATIFMGSSYLAGFAFLPVGDVHAAIEGFRYGTLWQVVLLLAGIVIYRAAVQDAGQTLRQWAGADDRARLSTLTTVPYLAMAIASTLAGLLHSHGALYGALWSAAATFGSNAGVLLAGTFARDSAPSTPEAFEVAHSNAWIAAGVVSAIVLFGWLGPGLPR